MYIRRVDDLYAVLNPDGDFYTTAEGLDDALQAAAQLSPYVQVDEELVGGEDAGLDGVDELGRAIRSAPLILSALRISQINGGRPISMSEIMRIKLEDAHRLVQGCVEGCNQLPDGTFAPGFPTVDGAGRAITIQSTPEGMAGALLTQNEKTKKIDPLYLEQQILVEVRGLSLLPAQKLHKGAEAIVQAAGLPVDDAPLGIRQQNWCIGSSKSCRDTCLVYAGKNMVDLYNYRLKFAKAQALMKEPVAFMRILVEAIERFSCTVGCGTAKNKVRPFVRLNVFSDIPWELVCPELFARYGTLQFYDYTKLDGRGTAAPLPSNYDLTFSYSGDNLPWVHSELASKRVAVVFIPAENWPRKQKGKPDPPPRPRMFGLPSQVDLGDGVVMPVVDGDVSDVRPLDPKNVVVGLRYKTPQLTGEGSRGKALKSAQEAAFVVPVKRTSDGTLIAAVTPRSEPITAVEE